MGNEKLAAVGIRPAVCHGQCSGPVVFKIRVKLIRELIAGSACSITERISTLYHEIFDNTVKRQTLIKLFF